MQETVRPSFKEGGTCTYRVRTRVEAMREKPGGRRASLLVRAIPDPLLHLQRDAPSDCSHCAARACRSFGSSIRPFPKNPLRLDSMRLPPEGKRHTLIQAIN